MEKEVQTEKKEQNATQPAQSATDPNNTEAKQEQNDPQTLSQAQRRGFSKQQIRKLQKRLAAKKKKELKQEAANKPNPNKDQQNKKGKQKKEAQVDPAYQKQFLKQKIVPPVNTRLPQQLQENILITSALPYVNNVPHLGNIIGCVLSADVYSRYKKLQGINTLYVCGTDEYGTATQVKAIQEKLTPQQICDKYHAIHADVYKWFDIAFDIFGRTSTPWHTKITQQVFLNLKQHDKVTVESMNQSYCKGYEMFLADRFVSGICPHCGYQDARGDQCDKCGKLLNSPMELIKPICSLCKIQPQVRATDHFYIKLPQIKQQLQKWFQKACVDGGWTQNSISITKSWLNVKQGLQNKCITRDLKWGVTVPVQGFQKKVFYVWFDAPIGYISITANLLNQSYEKWWKNPEQVKLYQFMGKDNVPFHTVMFPSSLIASKQGWTLLHHISTTEYLNYESGKFSKSKNTGVFGTHVIELQNDIASEVWRYYLLVNRPQKSDSQFSWKDFMDKNNNQLLANLGNLVHRALSFAYNNYQKRVPEYRKDLEQEGDIDFIAEMDGRYQKYKQLLDKVQIKEALKFSMETSSRGNKFLQDSKFWDKQNIEKGRTANVINIIINFIRFQSFLIEPFMPSTSAKINFLLGLQDRTPFDQTLGKQLNSVPEKFIDEFLLLTQKSKGLKQPVPLFTQLRQEQINQWRQRFGGKAV